MARMFFVPMPRRTKSGKDLPNYEQRLRRVVAFLHKYSNRRVIMKQSKSIKAMDVHAPVSSRAKKTTQQKKPKGQTIRLSPARTGPTAKLPGLLSEHCPAPETV